LIQVFEFESPKPGPTLLFMGAIHGNEKCGTRAIRRVIREMKSGKIKLQKGSITFVPIANPAAYTKDVRFVEKNLNRIFKPTKKPRSYEARLANELCRIVDRCDVILDIHSTTAKGQPFIYLDFPTARNRALAKSLGPPVAVTGWPQLYKKLGRSNEALDTPTYAAHQKKDGVLIECGQHKDPASPKVAYGAILNTMRHYGIIKGAAKTKRLIEIKISAGFFRKHTGDQLAGNWRHLDTVRKGDPIIRHVDKSVTKAPYNAYIIMPKSTARVGDDWLYLGRKKG